MKIEIDGKRVYLYAIGVVGPYEYEEEWWYHERRLTLLDLLELLQEHTGALKAIGNWVDGEGESIWPRRVLLEAAGFTEVKAQSRWHADHDRSISDHLDLERYEAQFKGELEEEKRKRP